MRVLFVEDDDGQIQLLNDAVDDWNNNNIPKEFSIITAPNVEIAKAQLSGSRIDFDDGLQGKGFEIKNPNAQSTCGCGKSFS